VRDGLRHPAGVEIGVASTKAFTTQLVGLFLLTPGDRPEQGRLADADEAAHLKALRHLPVAVQSVLALEPQVIAWSEAFARKENALFLGRGMHYPVALEGALKLKEISYIHAEAYPAGELKHGPLALVTSEMPVVAIAPNDALLEKLESNLQEVRARGGELFVFADADTRIKAGEGVHVIRMPEHYGMLSPILHVVPLQLLAYHTAVARGTDVDKPRNLAQERDGGIAVRLRTPPARAGVRYSFRQRAFADCADLTIRRVSFLRPFQRIATNGWAAHAEASW
jgi:glucosamine--fructose-6-phosphate aminotransferase (isomerizing)